MTLMSSSDSHLIPESKERTNLQESEEWVKEMDGLLKQLEERFQAMSSEIVAKMDGLSRKVGELEKSFQDIIDKHEPEK
jgi:hypothetical protein